MVWPLAHGETLRIEHAFRWIASSEALPRGSNPVPLLGVGNDRDIAELGLQDGKFFLNAVFLTIYMS